MSDIVKESACCSQCGALFGPIFDDDEEPYLCEDCESDLPDMIFCFKAG